MIRESTVRIKLAVVQLHLSEVNSGIGGCASTNGGGTNNNNVFCIAITLPHFHKLTYLLGITNPWFP